MAPAKLLMAALALGAAAPAPAPLPVFSLAAIAPGHPGLGSAVFRQGRPRLLNVFASWCAPCRAEAPYLLRLRAAGVAIDGLAVRDDPVRLAAFLARSGDPFDRIGDDRTGAVQRALGASGVPETLVVDGGGSVVLRIPGEIGADDLAAIVAALDAAR